MNYKRLLSRLREKDSVWPLVDKAMLLQLAAHKNCLKQYRDHLSTELQEIIANLPPSSVLNEMEIELLEAVRDRLVNPQTKDMIANNILSTTNISLALNVNVAKVNNIARHTCGYFVKTDTNKKYNKTKYHHYVEL